MTALWAIVLCGALSIVYAIWATASVLKADAGNPRMQEIAAAVREGAQAYLRRQYATIAIVGVVIFALLAWLLGLLVAVGFAIGAILSGAAGFIGMNVSVRANVRTAQAATTSLAGGLELAFKAGAITGMLVAGLALLGVTIYFAYLTHFMGLAANSRTVVDALVALGFGASLISIFARLGASQSIMGALYKGLIATGILSLAGVAAVIYWLIGFGPLAGVKYTGMALFECGVVGLVVTGLIIWITEYYTGTEYRPVKSIAAASVTGHGTNVIQGLAISMEATALPALVIIAGILVTYSLAGLFGIAIATATMLALAGMIVALDAFGPVTDNAGGIAEMAGLPKEVRKSTDALDAVGNTTKAVTKGYAIGSAGLGALVLFAAYNEDLKFFIANAATYPYFQGVQLDFSLNNPYVVAGLLFGGLLPYLFGAMGMTAVGRAASAIVEEGRRQFREKPGIMQGTDKPDYGRAVDLLTKAAIKEMVIPSLLPVLSPIVVYFLIYWIAGGGTVGRSAAFSAVGAMLLGVIVTGLFVAISMTSGGGAWDNAKKYIEDGHYGGKGSHPPKAAGTGDTLGDPHKDTPGPAVEPMIKNTNNLALPP